MNTPRTLWSIVIVVACSCGLAMAQAPVGTAFTYQGQLKQGGLPLTNTADFQFSLWDALTTGTQIGTTQSASGVSIANGLFTVTLDFGAGVFPGDARWLEIAVRSPAGGGSYTTLSPRQELTATPYALGLQLPLAGATTAAGSAFSITNQSTASTSVGIRGRIGGSPSYAWAIPAAVRGESDFDGIVVGVHGAAMYGVLGQTTTGSGVQGSAEGVGGIGLYGRSENTNGIGVFGISFGANSFAGYFDGRGCFIGDVGIGVNPPTTKLDVNGTAKVTGFQLPTGAASGRVLTSDAGGVGTWQLPVGDISGSGTAGMLPKFSGSKTLTNSIITETADGKIGVNYATPTYRFSLGGTLSNDAILSLEAAWNPEIYMNAANMDADCKLHMVSASRQWNMVYDGSEDRLKFNRDGSGGVGTVLCLDANNRAGVGLIDPTERLDVNGTARLRGIGTSTGTAVVADANGKLWKQSSSMRHKHNVADLPAAGDAVLALRPVAFEWNSTGEPDIGLIAEEVAATLPELVLCDAEGQPDAVKYDKLALYLLDVVRTQQGALVTLQCEKDTEMAAQRGEIAAQQAEITVQTERLATQDKELSELRTRLARLEQLVVKLADTNTGGGR
jgi:hypothetical protein